MDNKLKKIFDSRVPYKAGINYKVSKHNEEVAMNGLVTVTSLSVGLENVVAKPIDSDEAWLDGKLHVKPDYYLHVKDRNGEVRIWTIEVKTTSYDSFLNDEIIIKAPQVWTCKNDPEKYPRPYILAATDREFALIPMGSFWHSPPIDIKFGDVSKKGYLLKCDDYKWQQFVSPLKFKKYNGNKHYKQFNK